MFPLHGAWVQLLVHAVWYYQKNKGGLSDLGMWHTSASVLTPFVLLPPPPPGQS